MKLITKDFITKNKIDSLALFKRKFSEGFMEAHNKHGYAVTLFADLTHIPVPVRNKSFERIIEIDKTIKEESKAKIKDLEELKTVEAILDDVDKDVKLKKDKTIIREKLTATSNILHTYNPHESLVEQANAVRERFWKLAEQLLGIGGKGRADSGLPQTPA